MSKVFDSHKSKDFFSFNVRELSSDTLQVDDTARAGRKFEDLQSKYTDDIFTYERKIETSGWWTRFKEWLNDFFKNLFNLESRQQAEEITDVLIQVAGVILFVLVVYFIVKAFLNKEGQWVFGKSSDKSIIPVTDIESDLSAVDFKQLIKTAEKNGHYRLAIRYYYLWLLKKLNQAGFIEYDIEKTNSDYQRELTAEKLSDDFAYTSYLYNYIWYGEFEVNDAQFDQARLAYDQLLNRLDS